MKIKDIVIDKKLSKAEVGYKPYLEIGDIDISNKEYLLKDKGAVEGSVKAQKNDVLVSKVRPSRGAITILKEDNIVVSNAFVVLSANESLCMHKYLFYALQSKKFLNYLGSNSKGATYPTCSKNDVLNFDIGLDRTLNTQKNIVDTFERLSKIIKCKKQQLSEYDQLIKSRFVEMFGNPMDKSEKFIYSTYGDKFELNAGGTPSKSNPDYWNNGTISWIGSNLCQNVILYSNDGKFITKEGFKNSSTRLFPVDTVLIALVGATIGKTALLKFETTTNQNVLGVRGIKEAGYNPYFVYMYTQGLYQKFMDIGDGGFNMASKAFISQLYIPEIDISLQNEFAILVQQVDKLKFSVQKSLDETKELFDSLMQEYFG